MAVFHFKGSFLCGHQVSDLPSLRAPASLPVTGCPSSRFDLGGRPGGKRVDCRELNAGGPLTSAARRFPQASASLSSV
ncbi:hypothetical protein SKAU_G00324150 [Synaphobranchus kaupii]|uniref:Uncharacterized protein n=1 Tax=Synaphobranchus kaupii TaxID=118154 RepID=A0A9Q1EPF1_SYNKA|nr:hypothetical protein SKAU_G00324150 [Synaphobranchus kaupii]